MIRIEQEIEAFSSYADLVRCAVAVAGLFADLGMQSPDRLARFCAALEPEAFSASMRVRPPRVKAPPPKAPVPKPAKADPRPLAPRTSPSQAPSVPVRRARSSPSERGCSVKGCLLPHLAKGLCKSHYMKARHVNQKAAKPLVTTPDPVTKPAPKPAPAAVLPPVPVVTPAPARTTAPPKSPAPVPRPPIDSRLIAQDTKDDLAARLRVHGACAKPGERVLGKSYRQDRQACERCGEPCADGVMVRQVVRSSKAVAS